MIAGLPVSTLPARIERIWSEEGEVWLRLAPPPFPCPDATRPDLRVIHAEEDHVVLEQESATEGLVKWWARLEQPDRLHAGTNPPPAVIETPLSVGQAQDVFQRDIPEKGSPEWYADCIRERRLTPRLTVAGEDILEGAEVQAARSAGDLLLTATREEPFDPVDALIHEDRAVIFLCASYRTIILDERPPVTPVVLHEGAVQTLSDEDFVTVAGTIIDALESRPDRLFPAWRGPDVDTVVLLRSTLPEAEPRPPLPLPVAAPPAIGRRCLEEHELHIRLGGGLYSQVFRTTDGRALKVATRGLPFVTMLPGPETTDELPPTVIPARAYAIFTGTTEDIRPDAIHLLVQQAEKLLRAEDPALVRVRRLVVEPGLAWYAMDCLTGPSLRESVGRVAHPLSLFVDLARILDRLSRNPQVRHHGDLKPDNIILHDGAPVLIDPGHFGPLACDQGWLDHVTFTTPLYYPSLQPDDLYAFAVTLYEMVAGQHPFRTLALDRFPRRRHATDIAPPSALRPDLPKALDDLVLRGLRIHPEAPAIASFTEFAEALETWSQYTTASR